MLRAGCADDSHQQTVVEEKKHGTDAGNDAAGKGHEGDGQVVGGDLCGCLGLHCDDRVGPHLVMLDCVDHCGAEKLAHEIGAREGEQIAEQDACKKNEKGGGGIANHCAEDDGITVRKEVQCAAKRGLLSCVDQVVGAAYQPVEILGGDFSGAIAPHGGEVSGGLTVEEPEIAELGSGEATQMKLFGLLY